MNPKTKVLSYNLTDSFKAHILLTPTSRKFYLSYRLYSLEKLVSLEESLLISPSITSNESFEFNKTIKTNYEYKALDNKQTTLINKETHLYNDNQISEYNYQYKANGKLRLLSLNDGNDLQYEYDELGRISSFLKFNDVSSDLSINYQYDTYGNITSKITNNNGVLSTINYTYDSTNPTLLKECGNRRYNYNGLYLISSSTRIGAHFLNDTTYSYIGNKLASINYLGNQSISFKYGYNGLRNKKIIEERNLISGVTSTTEISYVYDKDKLILENHPDYQLRFQYDSLGKLLSIEKYNLNNEQLWKYYYIVNIFNDVLGLVNELGEQVVSYLYDPFGNDIAATVLSSEDSLYHNNDLDVFALNPFKYKSYYFDTETGLYYLTTRYYNPNIGRFISPDSVNYLESNELSGLNLFTYCGNDPVNYYDPNGHFLLSLIIGVVVTMGLVALGNYAYEQYDEKGWITRQEDGSVQVKNSWWIINPVVRIAFLTKLLKSDKYGDIANNRTFFSLMLEWDLHNFISLLSVAFEIATAPFNVLTSNNIFWFLPQKVRNHTDDVDFDNNAFWWDIFDLL